MKKILFSLVAVVAMALTLTGCKNANPVIFQNNYQYVCAMKLYDQDPEAVENAKCLLEGSAPAGQTVGAPSDFVIPAECWVRFFIGTGATEDGKDVMIGKYPIQVDAKGASQLILFVDPEGKYGYKTNF